MSEKKDSFRHDYIFLYYGITIKRIEMLGDKSSDVERLLCLMGHFLTGRGFELPAVCPGKSTVFCKSAFLRSF